MKPLKWKPQGISEAPARGWGCRFVSEGGGQDMTRVGGGGQRQSQKAVLTSGFYSTCGGDSGEAAEGPHR